MLLHSSVRTDAVVLEALVSVDPNIDLIPMIVQHLLRKKKKRKESNQSNKHK